jgi:hypothetical protein
MEKSKESHQGDRRVENSHETDTSSSSSSCLFGFPSSSRERPDRNTQTAPVEPVTADRVDNEPGFIIPGRHYFGIRAVTSNRFSKNYTNSAGGAVSGFCL